MVLDAFQNYLGMLLSTERLFPPSLQVDGGRSFQVKVRFDTDIELGYYSHGGILNFMVRKIVK